jgi:hypothetical protein
MRRPWLASVAAVLLAAVLLLAPAGSTQGARAALHLWWSYVLPALFPFLLAGELYLWGLEPAARLRPRQAGPTYLGLRPQAWPPLVAGLLGGYPLGAALADRWLRAGLLDQDEASRLAVLAQGPDPLFLTGLVAPYLAHGRSFALLLLGAQWVSLLPVAWLIQRSPRPSQRPLLPPAAPAPLLDPLWAGAARAGASVLVVGAVLTLVGAVEGAAHRLLPPHLWESIPAWARLVARSLVDGLSLGEGGLPGLPLPAQAAVDSALASFGGLTVWLEAWALTRPSGLALPRFLPARLVQAVASGLLTWAAVRALAPRWVGGVPVWATPSPSPGSRAWVFVALACALFGLLLVGRRGGPLIGRRSAYPP